MCRFMLELYGSGFEVLARNSIGSLYVKDSRLRAHLGWGAFGKEAKQPSISYNMRKTPGRMGRLGWGFILELRSGFGVYISTRYLMTPEICLRAWLAPRARIRHPRFVAVNEYRGLSLYSVRMNRNLSLGRRIEGLSC